MQYRDILYRIQACQSMFTRSLSDECVGQNVSNGEVIEDYPNALPAKLLLGWCPGHIFSCIYFYVGTTQ
jgi:hypothetical protein